MSAHFWNTKAKPFVVFVFSLTALGLLLICTYVSTPLFPRWYGLIPGIALMIAAIPFHFFAKRRPLGYLISFILNSVGSGCSVSAYYSSHALVLDLWEMLTAVLPAALVLLLVYLMLQVFSKTKAVTLTVAALLCLLLLAAAVIFWIRTGRVCFSFGFFSLLLTLFYLCVFGVTVNHGERAVMRDISFGSFGSFIILTVVVITLLSGGEVLDGLDLDLGSGNSKKKKTK